MTNVCSKHLASVCIAAGLLDVLLETSGKQLHKRLSDVWRKRLCKRREMHKKGRGKPEEGSKLSSKSANGLRQKVQKTGIFELFWPLMSIWRMRNELHKYKQPGNKEAREGTARFLLRHRSKRSHFDIFEHCVRCYARVVHRVLSASRVVSMQRRI